ncbi:unnamed protein product [Ixodes persulcatus]
MGAMAADKQQLIRTRVRYPAYLNVLLFVGTMSSCLGVCLCCYTLVYAVHPAIWIAGLASFMTGVLVAVLTLGLIAMTMFRRKTVEASWMPQSISPYEEDFGTDYYFDEASNGHVYKPTTYAAPKLQVSPLMAPVNASVYRLVYGVDGK